MLAHPDLALDLPFRVLISQLPDGQVDVSYHAAEELQRYGLDAASVQTLKKLEQFVQKNIQP
ncbi:Putative inner membrane or exported [Salmonella enterica subsp. enterica]|nr:Putative inner membrane or exported [Salmonella enterica subsp. enterica]